MTPLLRFHPQDVGIPGIDYGEFDLSELAPGAVPFKCSIFSVVAGSTTPTDCHLVRESWIVISGGGLLTYAGRCQLISARDMLYFESGNEHSVANFGSEPLVILSLWWAPDTPSRTATV